MSVEVGDCLRRKHGDKGVVVVVEIDGEYIVVKDRGGRHYIKRGKIDEFFTNEGKLIQDEDRSN